MKNQNLIQICLFLALWLGNQSFLIGQVDFSFSDNLLVSGMVTNYDSSEFLRDVHIVNTRTRQVSVSGEDGFFTLDAHPGDVLTFSRVGYITFSHTISDDVYDDFLFLHVKMEERIYRLPEIQKKADRDVVETIIRQPRREGVSIYGVPDYKGPGTPIEPTIMNPISALYDLFSKRGKQLRKLKELEEKELWEQVASSRYNEAMVLEIIGLQEENIDEFMKYCQLPNEFVIQATQYEMVVAILDCYEDFRKKKYGY